ncbi:MAG: Ig-like domain-containing protein, partial [Geminicoccales bacterium]
MMSDEELWRETEDPEGESDHAKINRLSNEKAASENRPQNAGQVAPDVPSLHLGSTSRETPTALDEDVDSDARPEVVEASQNENAGPDRNSLDTDKLALGSGGDSHLSSGEDEHQEGTETGSGLSADFPRGTDFPRPTEFGDLASAVSSDDAVDGSDSNTPTLVEASVDAGPPDEEAVDEEYQQSDDQSDSSNLPDDDQKTIYAPEANNDVSTISENGVVRLDVLGNDQSWNDNDSLSLNSASITSGQGSISIVGGEVSFDPGAAYDYLAAGETATVEIDYVVEDASGLTDTGRLTLTVTGTNDGPV